MTDDQILKEMGLSDGDFRDLLAKTDTFVRQLNPSQQKVLPTPSDAAATLGGGVTPDQLTAFIRARAPQHGTIIAGYFGSNRAKPKT
jgi:hypothetical protein